MTAGLSELFDANTGAHVIDTPVREGKPTLRDDEICGFPSVEDEFSAVAKIVCEWIDKGVPASDICVAAAHPIGQVPASPTGERLLEAICALAVRSVADGGTGGANSANSADAAELTQRACAFLYGLCLPDRRATAKSMARSCLAALTDPTFAQNAPEAIRLCGPAEAWGITTSRVCVADSSAVFETQRGHAYTKMGIHSHEEFINLVESDGQFAANR